MRLNSLQMSALVKGGGRGPQVNMFEQVSSLGDQMSLLEDPCTVNSHVGEGGQLTCGGTDTTENITFRQLRWLEVIILICDGNCNYKCVNVVKTLYGN